MRKFGKAVPEVAVRFGDDHAFMELSHDTTVLDVYDRFYRPWTLPPNIRAEVNNEAASLDQLLTPNDYLQFFTVTKVWQEVHSAIEEYEAELAAKKAAKAEKKARKRAKKFEKARQDLIELRKELG